MLTTLSILVLLSIAADAGAQTTADIPKWDFAASTGVFVGHPGEPSGIGHYDDWYHTATLGLTAGRYLTPHLKVEGEFTISGEGSRYVQRTIDVPGIGPRPVGAEQMLRTNSVSGALVWQFFDNQWVHPFVMAGATLDLDRERVHTWAQSYYRGDPRLPGSEVVISADRVDDLGTRATVRGLIGGGAKLYVAPRAFFRADTRLALGESTRGHVAFRLGFGVDF